MRRMERERKRGGRERERGEGEDEKEGGEKEESMKKNSYTRYDNR